MAEHRTPEEIEREIEVERAQLSSTLDTLTDKFSVNRAVKTGQEYVTEHGGEIADNLMRTLKETPAAAILTAVGVGWLIYGSQRPRVIDYGAREDGARERPIRDEGPGRTVIGRTSFGGAGYGGAGAAQPMSQGVQQAPEIGAASPGAPSYAATSPTGASAASYAAGSEGPSPEMEDFDARVADADRRIRARSSGTTGLVSDRDRHGGYGGDDDRGWVSRDYGEGRSEEETSMLERISDRAQELWHQTVSAMQGGYRSARRSVEHGYESAYQSATELRNSLFEGTDTMDVEGRERVASARAKAYEAQLKAQGYLSQGQRRANDFFYEQPLVAGALAMALGAVVGGLLPRTRREDEAFGAYRDQLFHEAESVFQDERRRAESAARAALAEAGQIAGEAKDSVLGRTPDGREAVRGAEDQARTAAQRIADAAREAHDDTSSDETARTA